MLLGSGNREHKTVMPWSRETHYSSWWFSQGAFLVVQVSTAQIQEKDLTEKRQEIKVWV